MGLLDEVLKAVGGGDGAGDAHKSLAMELLGMVSGRGGSGGLTGLVNMFNQKGLGDVVSSWVSTGRNLPISPEQIQNVLGSSQIQALAAKAGISPEMASSAISRILPQLVDKATPNGQIPAAGDLMSVISGMFEKS
ncbi:MAG: YidB family protein [Thermoanaerobaculia bacterium]|nr:YidB family protein [Thermoanaerobaculia bacterium]